MWQVLKVLGDKYYLADKDKHVRNGFRKFKALSWLIAP